MQTYGIGLLGVQIYGLIPNLDGQYWSGVSRQT